MLCYFLSLEKAPKATKLLLVDGKKKNNNREAFLQQQIQL